MHRGWDEALWSVALWLLGDGHLSLGYRLEDGLDAHLLVQQGQGNG